ncbi:MAG TPA: protein kinase [Polyangium sp.]|nr:protein kinase [Polyangium sp.]
MQFAGYGLLEKLGEGGMGIVYKARQVGGIERVVALKRIRDGEIAGAAARRRFLAEAKAAAELRHTNIVTIYEVRDRDGEPYFTMTLMSGGTLIQHAPRYTEPKQAAMLIAKIAHAVHAGHLKHIIHRDLKPANILFDDQGEPHIADFGVAKRIDKDVSTSTTMVGGTACYMAPEQADGRAKRDTVAVDIWSLGVILYELVAQQRPFQGHTPLEVLRRIVEDEPEQLEQLRHSVDRDFATICYTCLQKEPERRYISALTLAEDLERYVRGEAPLARRPSPLVRAARWCGRHPATTGLFGAGVLGLLSFSIWAAISVREQESARRQEVLATNVFAARAIAGTVLAQIREYGDTVAEEARNPHLAQALTQGNAAEAQAICEAVHARHATQASPIVWWFVMDASGVLRAQMPAPTFGKSYYLTYTFRDYFRGAKGLPVDMARPVYVSRAFYSTSDDRHKFAVVSPIRGEGGVFLGLLAAELATDRRLGSLELSDDRRIAVLTVRRDRDLPTEDLPNEHIALAHDDVVLGQGAVIQSEALRRLTARREAAGLALRDQLHLPPPEWVEAEDGLMDRIAKPNADGSHGPWLAGVAPVGNTELAVIVETRIGDATALDRSPLRVLAAWSIGGAVLLFGAILVVLRTRTKARSHL